MKSVDPGILKQSVCFSFTPSQIAKEQFFYPTWCGHYYCTENYFMKRDSYPPLLVVFIRKGVFRVTYRGQARRAAAGDVLLIDCMEPHYYHAENGLEFVYMHFDGSNAHEICRHIMETKGWFIQQDNNMLVGSLIYDMVRFYVEDGIESSFQSSMRIYRLFELLLSPEAASDTRKKPVEEAILYIRAHIAQPISLEELAAHVCLSVSYFSHLFKHQTGFPPTEYIINCRIEHAKSLLVRTDQSIAEIASQVGYASSGSLINLFVKRLGISPMQYRKQHQSPQNMEGLNHEEQYCGT